MLARWRPILSDSLGPANDLAQHSGESGATADLQTMTLLRQHLEQQATVATYQDGFVLMALLWLIGMPFVLGLRRQSF